MAIKSYVDEFQKKYERPQVDNLIVGFSGIDPQRKSSGSGGSCDCDKSELSNEQKSIVQNIIDNRLEKLTINYDGGNINPDDDDDEPLPAPPQPAEPVKPGDIDHELLNGLLGGDSNGHFHISKDELLKLAAYPIFSEIKHETLPDLLGGDDYGHFHLDVNELRKLRIMIHSFFPNGDDNLIIKPVAPSEPDEPSEPVEPYDPYGGLPSGTPPAWQINTLPSGFEASENSRKMYFGTRPGDNSPALSVPLLVSNTGKMSAQQTLNLTSWTLSKLTPSATNNFSDFYYSTVRKAIYWAGEPSSTSRSGGGFVGAASGGALTISSGYINSLCWSDLLQLLLAASSTGEVRLLSIFINKHSSSGAYWSGLTVNPGCAAWHPTTAVFCLTGLEGTSTSFDGETWTLNSDAPHNLLELSYRQDLDSFVARSADDKTFYASPDGINWKQLSDTPIPLDNITAVHYEPSLNWYCAVGLNDGNAYFSKDLKHWIPTKIRNNSPVDIADVIFMPSTGLYVAMPTSGTYFYTFNPSNWTD